MKIKRWFHIEAIKGNGFKHFEYVYNPYFKSAKYCLKTINIICNTNYKLEDVKYYFSDYRRK